MGRNDFRISVSGNIVKPLMIGSNPNDILGTLHVKWSSQESEFSRQN
jgi:hypothetical protein